MLKDKNLLQLNWNKVNGMIPVIIQDYLSNMILMHAYMNKDALLKTVTDGIVTFYSRTKKRMWTKGEISKNYLQVIEINTDCDFDALLILVKSPNLVCHLHQPSCFSLKKFNSTFLFKLDKIINKRKIFFKKTSYTSNLYKSGTSRIAQKVGEESIETILATMHKNKDDLVNEASDLIYHLTVLLHDQNLSLNMVLDNLEKRNAMKN